MESTDRVKDDMMTAISQGIGKMMDTVKRRGMKTVTNQKKGTVRALEEMMISDLVRGMMIGTITRKGVSIITTKMMTIQEMITDERRGMRPPL